MSLPTFWTNPLFSMVLYGCSFILLNIYIGNFIKLNDYTSVKEKVKEKNKFRFENKNEIWYNILDMDIIGLKA